MTAQSSPPPRVLVVYATPGGATRELAEQVGAHAQADRRPLGLLIRLECERSDNLADLGHVRYMLSS